MNFHQALNFWLAKAALDFTAIVIISALLAIGYGIWLIVSWLRKRK